MWVKNYRFVVSLRNWNYIILTQKEYSNEISPLCVLVCVCVCVCVGGGGGVITRTIVLFFSVADF